MLSTWQLLKQSSIFVLAVPKPTFSPYTLFQLSIPPSWFFLQVLCLLLKICGFILLICCCLILIIFADSSNTWCFSSYRHIWESRADSCLPLCFSILHQIRNLLFECTQVVLYIKPLFNCFLCIRFSIELYSLCTLNIVLKMWSGCCIWSQTDSKFLKEYSISSTTLDFLIIVLVSLESFFSSSFNCYAIHVGVGLVFFFTQLTLTGLMFFYSLWSAIPNICDELNIDLTSLILSPLLPSNHDLFLSNCTHLSDICVTPTELANLFSSSLFHNLLTSNPPQINKFFTKSTRLSTLYYYITDYNK